jgi:hypothetical protein
MKTLEKAVIEQYGTREEFLEAIPDIMQGGASAGVSGFIYYHETLDFTKKHFASNHPSSERRCRKLRLGTFGDVKGL